MTVCDHIIVKTRGLLLLSVAISLSCAGPAAAGSVSPDSPGHERQQTPAPHQASPPAGVHNERRISPADVPTVNRPDKSDDVDKERLRELERELAGDRRTAGSDGGGK